MYAIRSYYDYIGKSGLERHLEEFVITSYSIHYTKLYETDIVTE